MTLTAERVRDLFHYDEDAGILYWIKGNRAGKRAGAFHPTGYIRISIDGHSYAEHRIIWLYCNGEFPKINLDHINRNKADNRLINLRLATISQNAQNTDIRRNNKTGKKGVSWSHHAKRWTARIYLDYKAICIGYFDTIDDAANAYIDAAKKYHTHNPVTLKG